MAGVIGGAVGKRPASGKLDCCAPWGELSNESMVLVVAAGRAGVCIPGGGAANADDDALIDGIPMKVLIGKPDVLALG